MKEYVTKSALVMLLLFVEFATFVLLVTKLLKLALVELLQSKQRSQFAQLAATSLSLSESVKILSNFWLRPRVSSRFAKKEKQAMVKRPEKNPIINDF